MELVMNTMTSNKVRIGILGASGYTGAELVRLLAHHPGADMRLLTGDRAAGQALGTVFPHLGHLGLPKLIKIDDANWDDVDLVFCGLPHGTTQEVIAKLPRRLKLVDLSADFRLADVEVYAKWYGHAHLAPELQKEAVYGLTEHARDAVRGARLVANPGCYPTSALMPLIPLVAGQLVDADDIIIDAKSGMTGAGRAAKEEMLFSEVSEGIHAYSVAKHRHAPEIEQGLSNAAGKPIIVNFTAHLMPMNRGILASIYVKLAKGASAADLRAALVKRYAEEPFVRVLGGGVSPATRHVRGSNYVSIGVFADRVPGRAIVLCAEDNLVKGASGQAIQNMNVMCGLPETTGLLQEAMFP
jgi:N-acetyl-gamma-glutamyl-phosphate reductase